MILDGVSDEGSPVLKGKTPLEVAKTPNLDALASKSKMDYCYTVGEGIAPQSSNAVVSLLGQNPNFAPRGPLETIGAGVKLTNGDLALRTNFATIDNLKKGNLLDSRSGRTLTTKEARILAKTLNEEVKLPFPFEFHSTVHHRGVLVFRGGFSDNVSNADPKYKRGVAYTGENDKIVFSKPGDDEDDSKLSANLINMFMRHSHEVLKKHWVNVARRKKGLFPANFILCRDAGSETIRFKKLKGKWMALGYMPLEIGIARVAKIDVYKFRYPKLRGIDIYSSLEDGLKKAIKNSVKMLKRNKKKYDYFYVHFKETDTPGHDNKPLEKIKMIELLDSRFFSFLKKFIGNEKLVVTADHTTSCRKKAHTAGAVPVLIYPYSGEGKKRFTEKEGMKGKKWMGRKLLEGTLFGK